MEAEHDPYLPHSIFLFFFFNDTPPTETSPLPLHDALPISPAATELAADAGDDAVQAALAASVLFAAMVGVLGLGFWYNRRRLAVPFSRVAQALQRVAE